MRKTALALTVTLAVAACGGGTVGTTSPSTTVAVTSTHGPTTTTTPLVATTAAATTAPSTTSAPIASGFPVSITHGTGTVTLPDRPESIISLSPTATEILFAIGAGAQVVAVDSQSDYPPAAPGSDLNAYEPSVEAIAEWQPDLVVMTFDPGDIESGLTALGIPVIVQFSPLSLEDAYGQIEALGMATGRIMDAAALVDEIKGTVAAFAAEYGGRADPLTYYHELDNTFYSVTSQTFIGELYSVFGLVNVADPADAAGFGFPQLSPEFIIETDPDIIFLADTKCCSQSAATVAERPGWGSLGAVTAGSVVELDDDVASRWGPRLVDFLGSIAAAIDEHDARGRD